MQPLSRRILFAAIALFVVLSVIMLRVYLSGVGNEAAVDEGGAQQEQQQQSQKFDERPDIVTSAKRATANNREDEIQDPILRKVHRILRLSKRSSFDNSLLPSHDCTASSSSQCIGTDNVARSCSSLSLSSSPSCAVFLNRRDVPSCSSSAASASSETIPLVEVEKKISALHRSNNEEISSLIRSTCNWERPAKATIPWKPGAVLRSLASSMQLATDCRLPSGSSPPPAVTVHHLAPHDFLSPRAQLFDLTRGLTERLVSSNNHHASSSAWKLDEESKYRRYARASWIQVSNVVMTCEPKSAETKNYLNQQRQQCHTTLWTVEKASSNNGKNKKQSITKESVAAGRLAARSRGGRHSLFVQREASFVYGGNIAQRGRASTAAPVAIPGTTFYLPPFSVGNVGHSIHDGILGFAGALLARHVLGSSKAPKPWRIMIDADLFEASSPLYSFVMSCVAVHALGVNVTRQATSGTSKFGANPAGNDAVPDISERVFGFPTSAAFQFKNLIVSGADRTGNEAKFSNKADAAKLIRASVFEHLSTTTTRTVWFAVSQPPQKQPIRIAVYGRNDLYRRSIDNIGALLHAVREGLATVKTLGSTGGSASILLSSSSPFLVTTFYGAPAAQVSLAAGIDILVTAQGAHEQTVALFGAPDLSIIEICPCTGTQTSFVGKYGMFLAETQRLIQLQICSPMLNLADDDVTEQNVTLCPHHLDAVKKTVAGEVVRIAKLRGFV